MGSMRARLCRRLGAQVVAVVDVIPLRADALASECGAATSSVSLAALDWSAVDAVIISTPPDRRIDAALAAVRSGVPFFVEKPAGPSTAAVQPIVTALASTQLITAVGYMNRYRTSVQELRDELRDREVHAVECTWIAPRYAKSWWDASVGPLRDFATHLIDLCRYVIGEIAFVAAAGSKAGDPYGRECAALSVGFENGACGSLLTSSRGHERDIRFTVFHDRGAARLEGWSLRRVGVQATHEEPDVVFERETATFLRAVSGLAARPLCDFRDALSTQAVVDAAHHAIVSERAVRLS